MSNTHIFEWTMPGPVADIVDKHISNNNKETQQAIEKIRNKSCKYQNKYMRDISKTYTDLSDGFARHKSGRVIYNVCGDYGDYGGERSIEIWGKYNPGKMDAINVVLEELRSKNLNPKLRLSPSSFDNDDGCYWGGGVLSVICNL